MVKTDSHKGSNQPAERMAIKMRFMASSFGRIDVRVVRTLFGKCSLFASFRDSIAERTCLRDSIASRGGGAMELRGQGRAEMEFRHERKWNPQGSARGWAVLSPGHPRASKSSGLVQQGLLAGSAAKQPSRLGASSFRRGCGRKSKVIAHGLGDFAECFDRRGSNPKAPNARSIAVDGSGTAKVAISVCVSMPL